MFCEPSGNKFSGSMNLKQFCFTVTDSKVRLCLSGFFLSIQCYRVRNWEELTPKTSIFKILENCLYICYLSHCLDIDDHNLTRETLKPCTHILLNHRKGLPIQSHLYDAVTAKVKLIAVININIIIRLSFIEFYIWLCYILLHVLYF